MPMRPLEFFTWTQPSYCVKRACDWFLDNVKLNSIIFLSILIIYRIHHNQLFASGRSQLVRILSVEILQYSNLSWYFNINNLNFIIRPNIRQKRSRMLYLAHGFTELHLFLFCSNILKKLKFLIINFNLNLISKSHKNKWPWFQGFQAYSFNSFAFF
jgi:hypothetical protein